MGRIQTFSMSITTQRIPAEEELKQFCGDTPDERFEKFVLFSKHICDVELYPHQIQAAYDYFHHTNTIDVKPPRTGKSLGKALVNLYECATDPYEDWKIYTPKFLIGKEQMRYAYDWIKASPILTAFLRIKSGKKQISTEGFEFKNRSNCHIISVAGKIEGHNVTIMDIMEFDLWNWVNFQNDVLRRGGAKNKNGKPTRIRIDGTIMGKLNIHQLVNDNRLNRLFHNMMYAHEGNLLGLPPGTLYDADLLAQFGALDADFLKLQKTISSEDEVARSYYLRFTESTNFIWSRWLQLCARKGAQLQLEPVQPIPGKRYLSRGIVGVGFDCGHAGQKETSSKYVIHFVEHVNGYRRWLWGVEWPAVYDAAKLEDEIVQLFDFFRPDGGYGDALQHTMIASINDKAWRKGIHSVDRTEIAENTPGNWEKWWFSPIRNSGAVKHSFYTSIQQQIHKANYYFPYIKPGSITSNRVSSVIDIRRAKVALMKLNKTLLNIVKEDNSSSYPSYFGKDRSIGDDHGDALGMAHLWLDTHVRGPVNFNAIKVAGMQRKTGAAVGRIVGSDIENPGNLKDF